MLASREIVVACGPGGVGKTTTAAAAAAMAAWRHGGKVLVLTIDPARRLADALGLERHRQPREPCPRRGVQPRRCAPAGELWAAMLDTKESWDSLIRTPRARRTDPRRDPLEPALPQISARFVQSHDYIAMERLYEIHAEGDYDLIVVDTPPTRNALDFLDAPERMAEFFSSRLLRWLIVPYRSRLVNVASRPFYQIADRILGTQFLGDISQFFILFQTMYDGFIERAQAVQRLLADRRTTFIVVATLEAAPLREAQFFVEELVGRDLHVGAVVLNKVLPAYLRDPAGARSPSDSATTPVSWPGPWHQGSTAPTSARWSECSPRLARATSTTGWWPSARRSNARRWGRCPSARERALLRHRCLRPGGPAAPGRQAVERRRVPFRLTERVTRRQAASTPWPPFAKCCRVRWAGTGLPDVATGDGLPMLRPMRRRLLSLLTVTGVTLAVAVPVALGGASQAGAQTDLTPTATVHPGIAVWVDAGGGTYNGCTANFVFTNGSATYIGMAAHCAGTGSSTDTACNSPVLPDGTAVFLGPPVLGFDPSSGLQVNAPETIGQQIGTMVYNSWVTMQAENIADPSTPECQYNDLALVQVLPGVSVDPTVPVFGGPDGLAGTMPGEGSTVYSYQNSVLRLGLEPLSPKVGISLGPVAGSNGWSILVDTLTPGVPGDSGSGFLDSNGNAFGELSTISVSVGTSAAGIGNGVNSLAMELAFLNGAGGLGGAGVSLVHGMPFTGL